MKPGMKEGRGVLGRWAAGRSFLRKPAVNLSTGENGSDVSCFQLQICRKRSQKPCFFLVFPGDKITCLGPLGVFNIRGMGFELYNPLKGTWPL